jgi:hypothetical protein
MKLNEMFPADSQDTDNDIDWLDDLKFYIDNEQNLLSNHLFPVVKKHRLHINNPNVYKLYIKPIQSCIKEYCSTFEIDDPDVKFPNKSIVELAKKIAEEQKRHIENGDYETE